MEEEEDDFVGALVGYHYNNGTSIATIIASYATGTANGGGGNDDVGALVGLAHDNSVVTASYATGTANGDADDDIVGALVGYNGGAITASYATGTANGDDRTTTIPALWSAIMAEPSPQAMLPEPPMATTTTTIPARSSAIMTAPSPQAMLPEPPMAAPEPTMAALWSALNGDDDNDDTGALVGYNDGAIIACGTTLIPGQR